MNNPNIGILITEESPQRDAIHIAIAPVTAQHTLWPGQRVTYDGLSTIGNGVGIVDPFLGHKVEPGEKFWLFLYPGSVTSLRHHWTHPAFDVKETAMKFMDKLVKREGGDFPETAEKLIASVEKYLDSEGTDDVCLSFTGMQDLTSGELKEFWQAFESITGRKVTNPPDYFRCAC